VNIGQPTPAARALVRGGLGSRRAQFNELRLSRNHRGVSSSITIVTQEHPAYAQLSTRLTTAQNKVLKANDVTGGTSRGAARDEKPERVP